MHLGVQQQNQSAQAVVVGETSLTAAARVVDTVRLPHIAATLGGVATFIMQPSLISCYDLSTAERLTIGIKDNLVRLAIGIENTADILADLGKRSL